MIRLASAIAALCLLCTPVCRAQESKSPLQQDTAPQAALPSDASPALQHRHPRYRLEPGDVAVLTFTFSPEFNQTVTVQPDGFVSLLQAGDLYVSGKTVPEAMEAIKVAYRDILHDPVVSIVLTEFAKPYFIVSGVVRNPGKYDLHGDTTVSQAIAMAGGFTEASKHSEVWLYRKRTDDSIEAKKLNVKQMLARGSLGEDARLQSGDMIYVPQNTLSKVKGVVVPRATVGPTMR
jgi:polysaccharide export outer membrane protein